ncbi:hypothetical protein [Streptomyces lanatus]|uniref:Uncharacterized protein n=1 Tax=Streptomyces lanatus TaxID=66900 RepID=A0ABV1XK62_9ACTN|nr:hypothetical protein [Streptomyces lanatus]GHG95577.1 hypothetical protein GCM10018780_19170 [Streptomyces lanatus]
MPEATAPAPESGSPSPALRALGCGCATLIGLPLGAVLLLIATLAWDNRGSTDFPRVAPGDMASRAFQRSQEAYDVMGFTRTVRPGATDNGGVGPENTFGSDFCWTSGPLGLEDKTVDGAYSISHSWALDHVPASEAVAGLRRLHQRLRDDGWEVTAYREGGKTEDWRLTTHRDDGEEGDEGMSFTWYPDREYFMGGVTMPCAYDPGWKTGDIGPSGEQETPPALGPSQP